MADQRESVQRIKEIGDHLWFCMVDINALVEQDVNARMMSDNMMKQLSANVKKRGQLESVPYCCESGDRIEIISGHHRVKAAKIAGIKQIPILLDDSGLTRSQKAAKQIAHNSISGYDDKQTLAEIAKMIVDVDDMLESFFTEEFDVPAQELEPIIHVKSELEFRQVSLVFLDNQMRDVEKLLKNLDQRPDLIAVADVRDFDPFCDTLKKTEKVQDVKNVAAAVDVMVGMCNSYFEENEYEEGCEYVPFAKLFGGATCPKETANALKAAVAEIQKKKDVKSKWEALRIMAEVWTNGETTDK